MLNNISEENYLLFPNGLSYPTIDDIVGDFVKLLCKVKWDKKSVKVIK